MPPNFPAVYDRWKAKEIKAIEAIYELEMSKSTFYKMVKVYEKTRGLSLFG